FDCQVIPEVVVAFDIHGGFVTGGGWINSPAGAFPSNPTLTGKANFGLNAKFHHNKAAPQGHTEFHFNVGKLKLHSTSYDYLVVNNCQRAQFRGSAKVKIDDVDVCPNGDCKFTV